MNSMASPTTATAAPAQDLNAQPLYRSGAVARMVQMPVGTLRISLDGITVVEL